MRCVTIKANGILEDINPQPNDWSTCAYVLLSGAEAGASPFYLTAEEGAQISWAIVAVWSVAFVTRAIIKALKQGNDHAE